jgi:hypothetical protein
MAMQRATTGMVVAAAVAGIAVIALVAGLLSASQPVPNSVNVKAAGVGVYWNKSCTNKTSSISWGIVDPGGTKSFTVYVRNEGNVKEALSMVTGNWSNPSASGYMKLTWNCSSYQLPQGALVGALFTLNVFQNITGTGITSFGFYVTITGTEV